MYTDYKQPMSKNQLQSPMSPSKTQLSRIHARAKSEVHRSHTEAWRPGQRVRQVSDEARTEAEGLGRAQGLKFRI